MNFPLLVNCTSDKLSGMKELEFLFACLISQAHCFMWVHVAVRKLQILKLKLLGLCGRMKAHQTHY